MKQSDTKMAEERRLVSSDEKKYAILTKESIKTMAEAAGHADIPETVTGSLGEDVSYRLREITQVNTYALTVYDLRGGIKKF